MLNELWILIKMLFSTRPSDFVYRDIRWLTTTQLYSEVMADTIVRDLLNVRKNGSEQGNYGCREVDFR